MAQRRLVTRGYTWRMVQEIAAGELGDEFRRVAKRVQSSHEVVVVEDNGMPLAALVPLSDLRALDRLRSEGGDLYARASAAFDAVFYAPDTEEQALVDAVKRDRRTWFRERYGDPGR